MKKNKLLEKARELPHPSREFVVTRDECELFCELMKGNITVRQYSHALGFVGPGSASHRAMAVMRQGIANKWLKLELI